jgi:hypothetical protein
VLSDASDSCLLLRDTRASGTVAGTSRRPSSLQVDTSLARAKGINNRELGSDEGTSGTSVNVSVEERMNVAADNVNDSAENAGICLPDVERLSGGAWSRVSSASERGLARRDEGCELASGSVSGENTLVSDNDEFNERPFTPCNDVSDLLSSSRNTGLRNEDTKDHLEAGSLASSTDVLETRAVSAVDTDGGEAL